MQFLSENHLNGCQFYGRFVFLKTESEPNFDFPHISSNHITKAENLLDRSGRERCLRQVPKSNFCVRWPWTLTSWSKSWPLHPLSRWTTCVCQFRNSISSSAFEKLCSRLWLMSVSCDLDLWPTDPQSWMFHSLALWTICGNLQQHRFNRFRNIAFTTSVTDKRLNGRTDGRTDKPRRFCLPPVTNSVTPTKVSTTANELNPLMGTGNYSAHRYEVGTLAVDGWAVTFEGANGKVD